jgi:biotin operon repressor
LSGPRKSIIPQEVRFDRRLTKLDWQVYTTLGRAADQNGDCRRSQVAIAGELGYTPRAVNRSVKRLEALGYLDITHRLDEFRGGNTIAAYRLTTPATEPEIPGLEVDRTDNPVRAAPTHTVRAAQTPGVGAITTTLVERETANAVSEGAARHPKGRRRSISPSGSQPGGQRDLIPAIDAAAGARSPIAPRAIAMPADWQPSELDVTAALQAGLTPPEVGRLVERFRNEQVGSGKRRANWSGPFRNWVMAEVERGGRNGKRGDDRRSEAERFLDDFADIVRREDGTG